jgi:hypothetical protein
MTQDEIIEMAREAGLHIATDVNWMPVIGLEYAEKFAKLVEKKTRDHITNLVDEYDGWIGDRIREDAGETIEQLPDVDRAALLQELLPEIQKTFNLAYTKYKEQE